MNAAISGMAYELHSCNANHAESTKKTAFKSYHRGRARDDHPSWRTATPPINERKKAKF